MCSQSADVPERGSLNTGGLPKDIFAPSARERIVQAMAVALALHGYRELTIDDVVARARVTRDVFEEHFSSKEECGLAAINQILAEATAVTSGAFSPEASEWESVLRGLKALLELLAARPSFADLIFIQSRQAMPASAFDLYQSGFNVLASMLDRMRAYADAPEGSSQPSTAARAAIGGAEAVVRREIVAGRTDRLPQLLPDFIYAASVPFLGRGEALRAAGIAREMTNPRAG